jgi:hypothetical protein
MRLARERDNFSYSPGLRAALFAAHRAALRRMDVAVFYSSP